MARSNHLDPHASGVVNVRRNRSNCTACVARNTLRPQFTRQVLNEIDRCAVACVPCGDQCLGVMCVFWHSKRHVAPDSISPTILAMLRCGSCSTLIPPRTTRLVPSSIGDLAQAGVVKPNSTSNAFP